MDTFINFFNQPLVWLTILAILFMAGSNFAFYKAKYKLSVFLTFGASVVFLAFLVFMTPLAYLVSLVFLAFWTLAASWASKNRKQAKKIYVRVSMLFYIFAIASILIQLPI